jgi:hypothetical protein
LIRHVISPVRILTLSGGKFLSHLQEGFYGVVKILGEITGADLHRNDIVAQYSFHVYDQRPRRDWCRKATLSICKRFLGGTYSHSFKDYKNNNDGFS